MTRDAEARGRLAATLLGLAIGGLFLWLTLSRLSWSEIGASFSTAQAWPWIGLAAAAYLTGQGIRGLRCRLLVLAETRLPWMTATHVVAFGYAVNNVLPLRLGELARAGLLSERVGFPFVQGLTVTLLERVLDGWAILLLFLVAVAFAPDPDWAVSAAGLAAGLFGIATLIVAVLVLAPHRFALLSARIAGALRSSWQEPVWRTATYVANGVAPLRRPAAALRLVVLSLAVWSVESAMFLLVLPVFGLPLRIEWALLAMSVTNLAVLVPSTPGSIGPFHYFCAQALILLGVGVGTSTAYATTVHAVYYLPITLWGAALIWRYGIEFGSLLARSRVARWSPQQSQVLGVPVQVIGSSRAAPPAVRTSRLVASISEALSPEEKPDPERLSRVAAFVEAERAELSWTLRTLLGIGLGGFRTLVRLRYGRGFCELPLATRRRVVEAWAYGPYAVTRQVFRLLRSTALLGHYELGGDR